MGVYSLEPIEEEDLQGPVQEGVQTAGAKKKESGEVVGPEMGPKPEKQEGGRSQAYEKLLQKVQATASTTPPVKNDEVKGDVDEISGVEEESRVKRLVEVARNKGVAHAFKVASGLNDYYALDKLHDTLIDEFYAELVERGYIENE